MQNVVCHFTCKYCGAAAPLAASPTGKMWKGATGPASRLDAFIQKHGGCQLLEQRKTLDPEPFLLTWTADREPRAD